MTTRELIDAGNVHLISHNGKAATFLYWLPDDPENDAVIKDTETGEQRATWDIEEWRIDPAQPIKLPPHRSMKQGLGNCGTMPWYTLRLPDWTPIQDLGATTLKEARQLWRERIKAEQAARP